ncbi:hypothetical protein Tco_0977690 [Tanacetum coccineum]|uniref:Reverse transcriptase domain-containing protein n=1 Tax=Tanacetum coccineum TaxID=301880 RepID=A0ABQ5EL89_9ASTR
MPSEQTFPPTKKCCQRSCGNFTQSNKERVTTEICQRFKTESRHVKGAPKCIRISGSKHGMTNPELIKRLHDNIPNSVDEMMRVTKSFLREEVTASNQARKKTLRRARQKGLAENSKEGRSFPKGQSYGDSNGPTMAKSSQANGHAELLY